jgi:hypothetical protein
MQRVVTLLVAVAGLWLSSGCVGAQAPRVRFAKASAAQLHAVENENVVWYEFQPGDRVPLNFVVVGVAEAAHESIQLVAKRPFFIVLQKGAPPALSFDGQSVAYGNGGETFLALGRRKGENEITLISYVGKAEEMPAELQKVK